jgi:2-polyprenyl-3-methyl-5-hydroxy-6-metoxy-1,4-benzoquinol methylase
MNEDEITKSYYSNKNTTNFYLNLWGGDSIHIGIYPDDYTYNKSNLKDTKLNEIKFAIDNKKEYMYKFINLYSKDLCGKYQIADFGSGYGGTSRFLYDKLSLSKKQFNIDCFDISHDNCVINTYKNIQNNYDIPVYNISFLEISFSKKYNIIYSEDAFIHINERNKLFNKINKQLLQGGMLIFSDIILTDTYNKAEIQEVYDRVNITCLETHDSYVEKAKENNLQFVNSFEYKESMLHHYTNIRDIVEENLANKEIIRGLDNWIKHIELNNITSKIFIFKKN